MNRHASDAMSLLVAQVAGGQYRLGVRIEPRSGPSLIVVDVQKDYFDPRNGIGKMQKAFCVPGVRSIIRPARSRGWKIVHVVTEHETADSLPRRLRDASHGLYCGKGTPGAEMLPGIWAEGDQVVRKRGFSGFDRTELREVVSAAAPSVTPFPASVSLT